MHFSDVDPYRLRGVLGGGPCDGIVSHPGLPRCGRYRYPEGHGDGVDPSRKLTAVLKGCGRRNYYTVLVFGKHDSEMLVPSRNRASMKRVRTYSTLSREQTYAVLVLLSAVMATSSVWISIPVV